MLHDVGSVRVSVRVGSPQPHPVFGKRKELLLLRGSGNGIDASSPLPPAECALEGFEPAIGGLEVHDEHLLSRVVP